MSLIPKSNLPTTVSSNQKTTSLKVVPKNSQQTRMLVMTMRTNKNSISRKAKAICKRIKKRERGRYYMDHVVSHVYSNLPPSTITTAFSGKINQQRRRSNQRKCPSRRG